MSGGWASAPVVEDEAPAAGWASAPVVEDDEPRRSDGGAVNKAAGQTLRLGVQAAPTAALGIPALAADVLIGGGKGIYNAGRRAAGKPEIDNPLFPTVQDLGAAGKAAADYIGLPELPQSGPGALVGRLGQGALETAGGAGLLSLGSRAVRGFAPEAAATLARGAEAPLAQVGVGLAGQLGSEGMSVLAPDSMAAQLVGAGLGMAGGMGARAAIPAAGRFTNRALLRGGAVQDAVDFHVRSNTLDPERAVQNLSVPSVNAPGGPTAAQLSGDLGLVQLERDAQTRNAVPFTARREEQAAARNQALNSVQPEGQGNVSDLTDFVRRQLQADDDLAGAVESGARERARGAAEAIAPSEPDAGSIGRNIREPVAAADQTARANVSRLYQAVDPDGSLTVTTDRARQAAREIYGSMTPTAQAGLTSGERTILDQFERYGPEVSFRELQDLDQMVDAQRRAALVTRGPEYARLVRLKGAIRETMEQGAAERIASEPSVAARVQGLRDEFESGAGNGGVRGEAQSVQAGGVPALRDEASAGNGGSGTPAGSPGVRPAARDRRKGLTLSQFIARNGGLALDDEAAARDFGNVRVPGVGGALARPNGRSIDGYWRNKLIDEGYLPPDPDGGASRDITKELYDALERERSGGPATRTAEIENRGGVGPVDDETATHTAAVSQIRDELRRAGIREGEVSSRALNDAAERIARGDEKDAITVYERAVMALDDEPTPRPSYPEVPEPEGGFPNALGGYRSDPAAGDRYKAATAAARERKQTYGQGLPGVMLRETGTRGSYRMTDASVTANAFRPGPRGAERIGELVNAGAPHAAIADAAALSLSKHVRDGVLDPAGFSRWRQQHEAAFGALPEDVRARFASASLASEALGQATARRREAAAVAQRSALGRLANAAPEDVPARITTLLNSQNANRDMGELLRAARRDPEALEGLRRGVADEISRRVVSASEEVGASGEASIKADALARLLRDKRSILTQVFGEAHVQTMDAIAEDLIRAKRSTSGGVRIPGGSNTAQDTRLDRAARNVNDNGFLGNIMRRGGLGAATGGLKGAAVGAAAGLAESTIGSLRAAGLKRVDDLLVETLLDPALARASIVRGRGAANAEKFISRRLLAKYANPAAAAASPGDNE